MEIIYFKLIQYYIAEDIKWKSFGIMIYFMLYDLRLLIIRLFYLVFNIKLFN